jgi:DNA phosphorothioation-associated putative methyltransferase
MSTTTESDSTVDVARAPGKRVGHSTYWHATAIPERLLLVVRRAEALARLTAEQWNVCKTDDDGTRVTLLDYPDFWRAAFPTLANAHTVDLTAATVQHRRFPPGSNRPVLHRKELLLSPSHPDVAAAAAVTAEAESLGLFDDPVIIGHEWQWEEELAARGLAVDGHRIVRSTEVERPEVLRYRTALSRRGLSTPVQALWKHGLLSSSVFFDYGCGRGDDVAALQQAEVDASGWDPHFRPDAPKREADAVNLGFVLNVIEDPVERRQALLGAWRLARRVLAVGVLIGGRTAWERYRLHADGVLTTRGTFQKYFSPEELVTYVEGVTGRQPIPVVPGVVFVFRHDDDEQAFLRDRLQQPRRAPMPRRERPPRAEKPVRVRNRRPTKWELNADLLDEFWASCLALGRLPETEEFPRLGDVATHLGTPKRVLARLLEDRNADEFATARRHQEDELLVYLALQLFERRRSASAVPPATRRDVHAFFGSHTRAVDAAKRLLFSAGQPELISAACMQAAADGLGCFRSGEGLHVVGGRIHRLPAVLRVYVGCAERLYGEAAQADACKIHDGTGKLSLLHYDDFWGSPLPRLVERVKIDLRRLRIEFFQYDGAPYAPRPLYGKSDWMSEGDPYFDEQCAFDAALRKIAELDLSGHGPEESELLAVLAAKRLKISKWRLVRQRT